MKRNNPPSKEPVSDEQWNWDSFKVEDHQRKALEEQIQHLEKEVYEKEKTLPNVYQLTEKTKEIETGLKDLLETRNGLFKTKQDSVKQIARDNGYKTLSSGKESSNIENQLPRSSTEQTKTVKTIPADQTQNALIWVNYPLDFFERTSGTWKNYTPDDIAKRAEEISNKKTT